MEMSNKQIEKELFEIVEKRKELILKKQAFEIDIRPLREKIRRIQNEHMKAILEAVDPKGKPIYSNEEKRRVEWRYRTHNDENYNSLGEKIETINRELSDVITELNYLAEKRESLLLVVMLRTGTPLKTFFDEKDSSL